MRLGDVDAVLLDMDGTLVDSDAAVERAWAVWAGEQGLDPAAVTALAEGFPAEATVRRLRPDLPEPAVAAAAARQDALQAEDVGDVVAAEGAGRLLAALERLGLPWAVVTSAGRRLARARLGAAGIPAPLVVARDELADGKPDPEGYLRAAALLGVDPERCLVVEDSAPGVAAGRAAGARVAGLRGIPADVQVDDLAELAALLEGAGPAGSAGLGEDAA